ncbi:MAG: metallophosphatase family protein [Proteobacteria bacterium]|nr:metallophosphatase family protein [Pseudomonadota bacterium]
MRIALISDIHGNQVALDAVLRDIEQRNVDRIVCLGDVATLGSCPLSVPSDSPRCGLSVHHGQSRRVPARPCIDSYLHRKAGDRRCCGVVSEPVIRSRYRLSGHISVARKNRARLRHGTPRAPTGGAPRRSGSVRGFWTGAK